MEAGVAHHQAEGIEVEYVVTAELLSFGRFSVASDGHDAALGQWSDEQSILFPPHRAILARDTAKPGREIPVHGQVDAGLHQRRFFRGNESFTVWRVAGFGGFTAAISTLGCF